MTTSTTKPFPNLTTADLASMVKSTDAYCWQACKYRPEIATDLINELQQQLDVYRLALSMACGDEQELALEYDLSEPTPSDMLAIAQDELRHGRRPEWMDQ